MFDITQPWEELQEIRRKAHEFLDFARLISKISQCFFD